MRLWWEKFPGRLDREIASLTANGISFVRDDFAWSQGHLIFDLVVPAPDAKDGVNLRAFYPATFPYHRFEVVAPELALPRHQNPFGKNLCLLGRSSAVWSVHDTLGDVVVAQLPKLLRFIAEDHETLREIEERQGEPFSDFYSYVPDSAVLVDTSWEVGPGPTGRLRLVYSQAAPFRGAVAEVQDPTGKVIVTADEAVARNFPHSCRGRWVRWDSPIVENDPRRVLAMLSARHKDIAPQGGLSHQRATSRGEPFVLAAVFPEEAGAGQHLDAWLFVARGADGTLHLARPCRAGRADLTSRVPQLRPLGRKSVAAIGLGSLGASSAIEFARSGLGQLHILDFDFVEAGTATRWPLGLSAAGRPKVEALADFLSANYPYTRVRRYWGMIGHGQRLPAPHYSDHRDLDRVLDANLILDSSAETGLQHFLADLAAERSIPYICVSTTPGAWGGVVFRQMPGPTRACWACFQYAMRDNIIPTPRADPNGMLQPVGCAAPTFTGASFDIQAVSTMAVRMAVATLCADHEDGYPAIDWDVAVVNLRSANGETIGPEWHTARLDRHPDCANEIAHRPDLAAPKVA
jgi:hypothetical protein